MTTFLQKSFFAPVLLLALFIFVLPSSAQAVSCSIVNAQASYNSGDVIQVNAQNFSYEHEVKYDLRLYRLISTTESRAYVFSQFWPDNTSMPFSATIPAVPGESSASYYIEIISQSRDVNGNAAEFKDSNFCANNITIVNDGTGPAPIAPSCNFTPTSLPMGNSLTVNGLNFNLNANYTILPTSMFTTPAMAVIQSDISGSFTRTFAPVFSSTGSVPISISETSTSATKASCGTLTVTSASSGTGTGGSGTGTGGGSIGIPGIFQVPNPLNVNSFPELVERLLQVLLVFAVPILMLLIVYSGFLFLTSAGDPGKRRSAQEVLRWAVIGFALILAAWALVSALRTILGA